MIREENLARDYVDGAFVLKRIIGDIDQVESLIVEPRTNIKLHGHEPGQWEIWICLYDMTAYVCMPNEAHMLINQRDQKLQLLTIKGRNETTYEALERFFSDIGFTVYHGTLKKTD